MQKQNARQGWFERNGWRFIVAVESSVAGAAVAATTALMLHAKSLLNGDSFELAFISLLGAVGGFLGGLVLSAGFGRPGRDGWLVAIATAFFAPPLAGALAGSFLMPGIGTVIGGALALRTFCYPLSVAVWALCLVAIHLHARRIRPAPTLARTVSREPQKHCL